ncbi:response regulator [Pseudomonas gingeri]|uniref:response regulator n=1 Tax=Pseudomonas gingeri TaxID=117681 RepID=UPI0015A348C9|nr:response regulator [Pseudomonas gingeri]NWE48107.1 response regulator [Pseudomonas gingeri]
MSKQNLRVLLVEDHPFQLAATQSLLNSYGYHLLTPTSNAAEALTAMEASPAPFDLMLCDQCLPDLLGLELIQTANQRGKIKQAILLSSLSLEELQVLSEAAVSRNIPLLGCLTKPLNGLALKNILAFERQRMTKNHSV